jgi:hypothetical protein
MTQNRRFLGMTSQQLAILGGLAVLACVLFAVAACFFLQGAPGLLAPAPQNTLPPQPISTLAVIPTLTPTETPTPVPYEMLIPQDWVQFKTALIEIWLPKDFKKNKLTTSDSPLELTTELDLIGPASQSSPLPSFVLVSYEPMIANSLDDYLELEMASLSTDEFRVVEMRKVNVNSVDAIRLIAEMRIDNYEFNDMMYAFQDGGTVWLVQYVAQINDFYTMLETFEKSVRTFRMVR